MDMKMYRTRAS